MARTIESPGVEIRERDLTLRIEPTVGTNTWVLGYANQGPTEEPIAISSFSEFESVYGEPTNAAERYFYHTCREYLNSGANLIATRIPYGDGAGSSYGEKYGALVYPIIAATSSVTSNNAANITASTVITLSAGDTYVLAEPIHIELTNDQYLDIINNNISWSASISATTLSSVYNNLTNVNNLGQAGMIVVDTSRSMTNNVQEGYYLGVIDNAASNPATDYTDVINVKSVSSATAFSTINSTRLAFALSASFTGLPGSVSEILESIPNFTFDLTSYNDAIAIGLFKVRKSIYAGSGTNILDKVLVESYVGSLDASRRVADPLGGPPKSFFISDVVNNNSANLKVLVNPFISRSTNWLDASGNPAKKVRTWKTTGVGTPTSFIVATTAANNLLSAAPFAESRSLYAISTYATTPESNKVIGNIPTKLDRIFACVSNPDLIPIDVTVDGGLSTIWATTKVTSASLGGIFDDTTFTNAFSALSSTDGSYTGSVAGMGADHQTIFNKFVNFAESTRRDHIHVSDPLRQLFVDGIDYRVFTSKCDRVNNPFSKQVYWPLRNLYVGANTSYAAAYANWVRVYDSSSDNYCWIPFSGWAARAFAETDRDRFPWIAPAGLTRGLVRNVVDIAINPNQKERDLLYRIGMNPVCLFPNDGYVIWGQKTMFKKPSAFDRINVRRLFLALEKPTARVLKYFVFEPNTIFTRTQVVNVLTPLFENAKRNEGLYDYLIVCDHRNNTPDVIDRNELVIDIYLKPVKASEFILVNFIATRTGQDFAEVI